MDVLKREIERKRKALQEAKKRAGACKEDGSFVRLSDLRQIEDEQQQAEWEAKVASSQKQKRKHHPQQSEDETKNGTRNESNQGIQRRSEANLSTNNSKKAKTIQEPEKLNNSSTALTQQVKILPAAELSRQLRHLGLPVRLFGERLDNQRRQERLNQAMEGRTQSLLGKSERREYQLEKGYRIRNPFLEKDQKQQSGDHQSLRMKKETPKKHGQHQTNNDSSTAAKKSGTDKNNKSTSVRWEDKDPHDQILDYFQGLLLDWERQLATRPDHVKQSLAGKTETKTARQCRDYIRPLFRDCQLRQLDQDTLLQPLARITQYGRAGEFIKAHQAYMDVAIGRAAWPIGVTMVGIHARTGRAKIESANVAHVMNSELQRKYLTSIKRLLTFAQSQREDVDPSKKVLA
ncbi:hypothetical protein ACA910_011028 [Epithemia clementina (nom. ined.)]